MYTMNISFFFFTSRRRHTRWPRDWSSDVCSSDLVELELTDYGEEMGFQMDAPPSEVFTTFSVNGSVEQVDQLKEDYVWVRSEERRVGKEWRFGGSAEHVLG